MSLRTQDTNSNKKQVYAVQIGYCTYIRFLGNVQNWREAFSVRKWLVFSVVTITFILVSIPVDANKIADHEQLVASLEQPPQSFGIKVYDANEQFLGILLDGSFKHSAAYEIFIPSLNVVTVILQETGARVADIMRSFGNVYFEDNDCCGPAYLGTFSTAPNILYRFGSSGNSSRYFFGVAPEEKGFYVSSKINFKGDCLHRVSSKQRHSDRGYRAIEISKEEIPFNLPVPLPLRYEW